MRRARPSSRRRRRCTRRGPKASPSATQDKATALFEEGNTLFAQQAHAPALEKYRAARRALGSPADPVQPRGHPDPPRSHRSRLPTHLEQGAALSARRRSRRSSTSRRSTTRRSLKGRVGYVEATCDAGRRRACSSTASAGSAAPARRRSASMAGEHTLVGELAKLPHRSQPHRRRRRRDRDARRSSSSRSIPRSSSSIPYRRWIPWTITGGRRSRSGSPVVGVWFAGRGQMKTFERELRARLPDDRLREGSVR